MVTLKDNSLELDDLPELDDDLLETDWLEIEDIDIEKESIIEPKLYNRQDELGQYLSELHQFSRISAAEEIRLSELVQAGIKAKAELTEANQNELTPIIEAGQLARDQFINANYKLVVAIAKRYFIGSAASFTKLDIIQSGNLGLIKAVDRFDGTKGFKFSTYATNWIIQMIRRELMNKAPTIRIPVHRQELINKIYQLEKRNGPLSIEALAKELDLTTDKIEDILQIRDSQYVMSLDSQGGDLANDYTSILDVIASDTPTPDKVQDLAERESLLHEILCDKLTDREHYVIIRRYGLRDARPVTLEILGDELGVTRERVRQIEAKAMRKLKASRTRELFVELLKNKPDE